VDDYFQFTQTTNLTTLTPYSVSESLGAATASDTAVVTVGTLHVYSNSFFPLDSTTGDSQGYVTVLVDDTGIAPGATGLPYQMQASYGLSGFISPGPYGGGFDADAVMYYSILDNTKGTSVRVSYDSQIPGNNVPLAFLNVNGGDQLEISVDLQISTYQAGNAASSTALVDLSHTVHIYADTNVPGLDYTSSSGYDYATPSGVPEPSTWTLALGALLTAAFAISSAGTRARRAARDPNVQPPW
jgi:hypothetical protein